MRLLSANAAAAYCNYNAKHFRDLKKQGRGPKFIPVEGSKMCVYTINDLEEWMFEHPKRSYLDKTAYIPKVINPWSKK